MFSISNGELTLIQTLLSLSGVLAAIITSLYAIRQMKQARSAIPSLDDFVWKNESGEVMMDERLVLFVDAFGSRVAKSLRMAFLQGLGAESKIDKGIKTAMMSDVIDQKMPLLNLVGDFLGINTKQYISKHPEAIMQLAPMLQGFMKGNNGSLPQGQWKDPFV